MIGVISLVAPPLPRVTSAPGPSTVVNRAQAFGPVAAHPGKHHAETPSTEQLRHRTEHGVRGGADAPERRFLIEGDLRTVERSHHPHMIIARSHVRCVLHERRAVVGFDYVQRAHRVEAFREAYAHWGGWIIVIKVAAEHAGLVAGED